jgi:hypothetical protein
MSTLQAHQLELCPCSHSEPMDMSMLQANLVSPGLSLKGRHWPAVALLFHPWTSPGCRVLRNKSLQPHSPPEAAAAAALARSAIQNQGGLSVPPILVHLDHNPGT